MSVEEKMRLAPKNNGDDSKRNVFRIFELVLFVICVVFILLLFIKPEIFVKSKESVEESAMENIRVSTEADQSGSITQNQAMTYFMGYDYQMVTGDGTIPLGNDAQNADDNIYLEYTIKDVNDNELYKSDLIAPGMELAWKPSSYLPYGEHELIFHEQPYKIIDVDKEITKENLEPLYYIDQNVTVMIVQ